MPKAEVGTPKWLANKMRAKGLQKLRWYCQMCEKQCRDENGFKCHRMSEAHQRQMQLFVNNPGKFMDDFSKEFEAGFMQLMRTRYCRTRVLANHVYQEYIGDKTHIHMNGTIWTTLSGFVQYLGRTGKCKIERTEKGWHIEYIDHEKITRDRMEDAKRKVEVTDEVHRQKRIEQAVHDCQSSGHVFNNVHSTALERNTNDHIISFTLPPKKEEKKEETKSTRFSFKDFVSVSVEPNEEADTHTHAHAHASQGSKRKMTTMEKLRLEEETKKFKQEDTHTHTHTHT
eukprot:GHVR01085566.1.p1 GENE.GHVR01085566.1~~GHVR01085566.1.p1  ORF type:complete len:285 (+),score=94.97 GHVR01085566.1:28-882(+)